VAGAADVEWFTSGAEDDGNDLCVAGMSALIGPPNASEAESIRPCSTGRLTVTTT
jgi:hypothetical protein